jgi:hypothetical protein
MAAGQNDAGVAQAPPKKTANLLALAQRAGFASLSRAEVKVLEAAPTGLWAACQPEALPFLAGWKGADRSIRAALLEWLCTDQEAVSWVSRKGLLLWQARVDGTVDLSYREIPFPLTFGQCLVRGKLIFDSSQIGGLSLSGSHMQALQANRLQVRSDLWLDNGLRAAEGVQLYGVDIRGSLLCSGSRVGSDVNRVAIEATGSSIQGSVFFDQRFKAKGEVRLYSCRIGDSLLAGSTRTRLRCIFANAGEVALNAEAAQIAGTVMINGVEVEGELRFYGAQIRGTLECRNTRVENPHPVGDGTALNFVRANVKGSVFLYEKFRSYGEVRAYGAQIGGDLYAEGAIFVNAARPALDVKNLRVSGDLILMGCVAKGEVRALGAQVGGDLDGSRGRFTYLNLVRTAVKGTLRMRNLKAADHMRLDLTNASTAFLDDDESSWPSGKGSMVLEGFDYGRISGPNRSAESRLKWLAVPSLPLQDGQEKGRREQGLLAESYRQLAKVLSEAADDDGARKVLYELEVRRRRQSESKWWQRGWDGILRTTIGYGVYPVRAIRWLIALTMLGTVVYGVGYLSGSIVPGDEKAYSYFEQRGAPPNYYPRFNAFIFSMENTIPLLKFGQDSAWIPNPTKETARKPNTGAGIIARSATQLASYSGWIAPAGFLRWFRWFLITVGWILGTLFLAGVTGIVRSQ